MGMVADLPICAFSSSSSSFVLFGRFTRRTGTRRLKV